MKTKLSKTLRPPTPCQAFCEPGIAAINGFKHSSKLTFKMRNMKHYAFLIMPLLCAALFSCNDGDLDMWEVTKLEATCPIQDQSISHEATTTNVDIKTNAMWYVTLPDWMHAEQTTGKGNANIVVRIDGNEENFNPRSGKIAIVADNSASEDNIVGSASAEITIQQEAGFYVDIVFTSSCTATRTWTNSNKYRDYYKCNGEYSYEITSNLSDEELAEILSDLNVVVKRFDNITYWELTNLPTTKGQHKGTYPETVMSSSSIFSYADFGENSFYYTKDICSDISYELKGIGKKEARSTTYWIF